MNIRPIPWWFVAAGLTASLALLSQYTAFGYLPAWVVGILQATQGLWAIGLGLVFLKGDEQVDSALIGSVVLVISGVPGSGVSLAELVGEATVRGIDLSAETVFVASSQTFPYGAHGAIVEIDLDTGDVDVVRIVAVDDCGTILDPMIVSGQVHGSLAQGLGQATLEAISTSENGVLRSSTFMDYLIPTASDVPEWELHHLETPSPSNPLGAKGIGESGTIGLPPAIVNAVLDALEPLGVTHIDMPVTPARVWAAVDAARRARPR